MAQIQMQFRAGHGMPCPYMSETNTVGETHAYRQAGRRYETDFNGWPVPLCGTGRYKGNTNCNVKDARLKRKSRRPLQSQILRQPLAV